MQAELNQRGKIKKKVYNHLIRGENKGSNSLLELISEVPHVAVDEGHNRESREPIKKRKRRLDIPSEKVRS